MVQTKIVSLGSDHIIVVANVTLILRATKQTENCKPKYVWSDLRGQDKLCFAFNDFMKK